MSEVTYESVVNAEGLVTKNDFPIPRKPSNEEKKLAEEFNDTAVGDISDDGLMKYMGLFTGFLARAEWELAKADAECDASESTQTFHIAGELLAAPKSFTSVKEKEAWVRNKNNSVVIEKTRLEKNAYYVMLKALVKGYEKKYNLCSRELSKRVAGMKPSESKGYST